MTSLSTSIPPIIITPAAAAAAAAAASIPAPGSSAPATKQASPDDNGTNTVGTPYFLLLPWRRPSMSRRAVAALSCVSTILLSLVAFPLLLFAPPESSLSRKQRRPGIYWSAPSGRAASAAHPTVVIPHTCPYQVTHADSCSCSAGPTQGQVERGNQTPVAIPTRYRWGTSLTAGGQTVWPVGQARPGHSNLLHALNIKQNQRSALAGLSVVLILAVAATRLALVLRSTIRYIRRQTDGAGGRHKPTHTRPTATHHDPPPPTLTPERGGKGNLERGWLLDRIPVFSSTESRERRAEIRQQSLQLARQGAGGKHLNQSKAMDAAHAIPGNATTQLSLWSQTAPRDWVAYALCFPLDNKTVRSAAQRHLSDSLAQLAISRPVFAGRLRLSTDRHQPGRLLWVPSDGIDAGFQDISTSFEHSYAQLSAAGFPPCVFANKRFALGINPNPLDATQPEAAPPATNGATNPISKVEVPVVAIRGFFIKGGLLMMVFMHHGFGDGVCMRDFLDDFASETRRVPLKAWNFQLGLPDKFLKECHAPLNGAAGPSWRSLKDECPEYEVKPNWTVGPTQPVPRDGHADMASIETDAKIFVIGTDKLASLKRSLRQDNEPEPSAYVSLSALTWAHITRARFEKEKGAGASVSTEAMLSKPVNWKEKVHGRGYDIAQGYFGNATAKCLTFFSTPDLVEAALLAEEAAVTGISPGHSHVTERDSRLNLLRAVAAKIKTSIGKVDDTFVAKRTRLYESLPDPRNLGLIDDPRAVQQMQFNTWRPFGADAQFSFPGLAKSSAGYPERIRKVLGSGRADFRNVLIMPARRDAEELEIFISLPRVSLDALCSDRGFTRWFDKIISTGDESKATYRMMAAWSCTTH